jgi:hypothetical protein
MKILFAVLHLLIGHILVSGPTLASLLMTLSSCLLVPGPTLLRCTLYAMRLCAAVVHFCALCTVALAYASGHTLRYALLCIWALPDALPP